MIDVNNLMLGNFVSTKDGVVLVGKIHRDSVADKWGGIYFDDEIEGIEVTGELLEKMGFVKTRFYFGYWGEGCAYKLEVDSVCNNSRKWNLCIDNDRSECIGSGDFTYLHELMNLVRVITGYELKIEKEVFYV